jgi:hypothetical protein
MLISTSKFVLLMQICATWTYMLDFLHFKFTNYAVDNIICRSEKTETESSLEQHAERNMLFPRCDSIYFLVVHGGPCS